MLAADRNAVICDLAETYGILDYKALPVPLLATLCSGLRETSRIKLRLSGMSVPSDMMLLAAAVDKLFDLRPAAIISRLDLRRPIYRDSCNYGHFGKAGLPWEETNYVDALRREVLGV